MIKIILYSMKTEISISNETFDAVEHFSLNTGMSKSVHYTKTVLECLNKYKTKSVIKLWLTTNIEYIKEA